MLQRAIIWSEYKEIGLRTIDAILFIFNQILSRSKIVIKLSFYNLSILVFYNTVKV